SNQLSAFDLASEGRGGGYLGALFAAPLYSFLGFWAGSLILFALAIIALLITFDVPLRSFFGKAEKSEELEKSELTPSVNQPAVLKINAMGKEGFSEEKV